MKQLIDLIVILSVQEHSLCSYDRTIRINYIICCGFSQRIPCSPYSFQPSIQLSFSCCHVTPCHFFECPKPGSHHTATIICGTRLAVAIVRSDPTWGQKHEVKNITEKNNMTLPSKSWQSSLFHFRTKSGHFAGVFFCGNFISWYTVAP